MMKTIPLTKGMVALVDDEDFDFLNQWKWHASSSGKTFYARRDEMVNGVRNRIYMHRIISGVKSDEYVDHIDHNTLNNQRTNLRNGSQIENMGNCRMQKHNSSGFKGVFWNSEKQKWGAAISNRTIHGKRVVQLGRFLTPIEAAIAYDNAALKKYGQFALTNKLMGLL